MNRKIQFILFTFFLNIPIIFGAELRDLDDNFDYFAVFHGDNANDRQIENIKIYSNKSLKGSPAFTLTNKELKDNRKRANPNLEFFITEHNLLKLSDYRNSIATLIDGKNRYYFRLTKNIFYSGKYPHSMRWKRIRGSKALKSIKQLLASEPALLKFSAKYKKCAIDKDVQCLISAFVGGQKGFYEEAHFFWKYENLSCEDSHQVNFFYKKPMEHEEPDYKNLQQLVPWPSLIRLFSLDLKEPEVSIITENFEAKTLSIHEKAEKKYCNGRASKAVILFFTKEKPNYWKLDLSRFIDLSNPAR